MNLNGLLLLDKPSGMTSHDVVDRVRKVFGTRAVGHAGTLDPMAEGLMVLLLNEGTKLSQYILEGDKSYIVKFRLGYQSDTLDSTGVVQPHQGLSKVSTVTDHLVQEAIQSLMGEFSWEVPQYSAVKVDGQKMYERARAGESFLTPSKLMKFWGLTGFSYDHSLGEGTCYISCSKGSFIRSWVQKLGEKLQTGALMIALRRTESAPYKLDQSVTLEHLESLKGSLELQNYLVPMSRALPGVKRIYIKGFDLKLLRNGQISHDLRTQLIQRFQPGIDKFLQILTVGDQELVALIGFETDKGFEIKRVFAVNG